jgi:hypothetical protein
MKLAKSLSGLFNNSNRRIIHDTKISSRLKIMSNISPKTRVRGGSVLTVLGIIIIAASLMFPFHFFLEAWSHTDDTFVLETFETTSIYYDFFIGGIVRGMILPIGGGNVSLDIEMKNSNGEVVHASENIEDRYFLEFQPSETGLYHLVIYNPTDNTVSVYVIIWQYYYNILLTLIGITVFAIGIIMILMPYVRE